MVIFCAKRVEINIDIENVFRPESILNTASQQLILSTLSHIVRLSR